MPYLHVSTTRALSEAEISALIGKLEEVITLLPGKTRDNAMLRVDAGCRISMGGAGDCAFVDVRLYKASPGAAKGRFAAALTELLGEALGVPSGRVYINLLELPEWAAGGSLF